MCIWKSRHWDCGCWIITNLEHCDREDCWCQMLYPGFLDMCPNPSTGCCRPREQVGETQGGSTQGGNSQGSNPQSRNPQDNNTRGSSSQSSNTQGNSSQGGSIQGSTPQGSNTRGSSSQGSSRRSALVPAPVREQTDTNARR